MFLKDLLIKLLYKTDCEYCSQKLGRHKFFCEQCQNDFYYELSQNQKLVKSDQGGYFLILENSPYFKLLIQRAKNPRNVFLIEGIASLVVLTISAHNLPWPQKLVETQFFESKYLIHLFFKKLSNLLNYPISQKQLGLKWLFFSI